MKLWATLNDIGSCDWYVGQVTIWQGRRPCKTEGHWDYASDKLREVFDTIVCRLCASQLSLVSNLNLQPGEICRIHSIWFDISTIKRK